MNANTRNVLEFILEHIYNPRPHLDQKVLELFQVDGEILSKNPMKFIKFLRHNYGMQTGEQIAEMFYDKIETPPPLPHPPNYPYVCKYCGFRVQNAGDLQIHEDVKHSNSRQAGVVWTPEKEKPAPVYEPERHPVKQAEEVLEEDSKKWASEYITAPTDTPMDKAEELKKQAEMQKIVDNMREQWLKNKPPKIPVEKMKGLGPDAREAFKAAQNTGKPAPLPYTSEEGRELYVGPSGRFGRIKKKRGRPKTKKQ